jgi:unsaturated chondroitin disaccharide hydrolase
LWLAAELTGDNDLQQMAREFTTPLEQEKTNNKSHDMGFKMMSSFGQGYRLTNDSAYRSILIQSAKTLTTRFNEKIGAIRSWDHNRDKWQFPVIIDNMMNLELLFWASKQTGDQLYYNIAVKHAETTLANHFREDNSSFHVVDYDTLTGAVIKKNTHQGFSDASAWSRGQAWGLYGYTMCYRETGIVSFLYQAEKIADFILNHPNLPADKIPYWDFDAPAATGRPRDVSAATITASALYELAQFVPQKRAFYIKSAGEILSNLNKSYLSKPGENKGFLLGHSTGSFPHNSEIDVPINYADYYYLEALVRQFNFNKLNK